jgi:multiple sugar transport system permease protein
LGAAADMTDTAIFRDSDSDRAHRAGWWTRRIAVYGALILWAAICLFPIYWTITTSFKEAINVQQGHLIPFVDFEPSWKGWRSLGLSPDTIGELSTPRFGYMRNGDISFFFLSQLILPPVVLALPFLVLYREVGLLDTRIGLILLYTLTVLPIVIWIMRDQFAAIPTELEEAALVDGLSIWGAFLTIILPIALPGMVAAFLLCIILTWNEYFFAALLTSTHANTLPAMVASQTGSQGINWWSMAALSFAAIMPLIVIGVFLERFIIKGMAAGAVK